MRSVSVVGIGQVPVQMKSALSLRELGANVVQQAMADAGIDRVDALYASNMLGDELQMQKHIGALIADEAGLTGIEAIQVRAATAGGAAALRVGYLAVASGTVDLVAVVGVEKMSDGGATSILAKALDAEREVPNGATLVGQNAMLMRRYCERYHPPEDGLAHFSVLAHDNARNNRYALFRDRQFTTEDVLRSRVISPPVRLLDCSPLCDGAAAVVLAPAKEARHYSDQAVRVLASRLATDRFRLADRSNPLLLAAARQSLDSALGHAGLTRKDVNLFELHDAFSIMACLSLEAAGFADPGEGWRMAADGETALDGRLPVATMGGLKARGHPVGATALYQICEIVLQLTGRAGQNQVPDAKVALTQSVGGAASTVVTHLLGV